MTGDWTFLLFIIGFFLYIIYFRFKQLRKMSKIDKHNLAKGLFPLWFPLL